MSLKTEQQMAAYTAAHARAAFYRVPDAGLLRLAGADRVAFIQRQTTNDARSLAAGHSQLTVLTSATARILDVWRLALARDDAEVIEAIPLPGQGAATAAYLKTRIFFMDKVTVTDESDTCAQFTVMGPEAPKVLAALGFEAAPEPDAVIDVAVADGVPVRAFGLGGLLGRGTLLVVPAADADMIAARLAESGAVELDAAAFEMLRIEMGFPAAGRELTPDYTPLEANLDGAISDSKGCYTGQEIIARQVTYDKVTRRLVGLRVERLPAPGAAVTVEERTAGTVTSVAETPHAGSIALAIIKRPYFEVGTVVRIAGDDGSIAGEVVALPFAV